MKRALLGLVVVLTLGLGTPAYADRGGNGSHCNEDGACSSEREEDYTGAGCKYFCPTFDKSPVDFHDNNITLCMPFSVCGEKPKDGEGQPPSPMPPG